MTALLLMDVLAFGGLALADVARQPSPAPDPVRAASPTFHIRGSVRGLYPGRVKKMRVRIRNPFGFPIKVREIRPRVQRPYRGCPPKAIRVRVWHGNVRVVAHTGKVVGVRIRMKLSAPNACQGARFPVRFRGTAVRA